MLIKEVNVIDKIFSPNLLLMETTMKGLFYLELIISIILVVIAYKKCKEDKFIAIGIIEFFLPIIYYGMEGMASVKGDIFESNTNGNSILLAEIITDLLFFNLPLLIVIIYSIYKIKNANKNKIDTSKGEIKDVTND